MNLAPPQFTGDYKGRLRQVRRIAVGGIGRLFPAYASGFLRLLRSNRNCRALQKVCKMPFVVSYDVDHI